MGGTGHQFNSHQPPLMWHMVMVLEVWAGSTGGGPCPPHIKFKLLRGGSRVRQGDGCWPN